MNGFVDRTRAVLVRVYILVWLPLRTQHTNTKMRRTDFSATSVSEPLIGTPVCVLCKTASGGGYSTECIDRWWSCDCCYTCRGAHEAQRPHEGQGCHRNARIDRSVKFNACVSHRSAGLLFCSLFASTWLRQLRNKRQRRRTRRDFLTKVWFRVILSARLVVLIAVIEVQSNYTRLQGELQALASKIGELESEAEEHECVSPILRLCHRLTCVLRLVLASLKDVLSTDPSRKCFRLIGGVLVERTVKDVAPALQTNRDGVSV